MKPWEAEKTRTKMKKLSGEKTVRLFFDLYQAALKITRASMGAKLSSKQFKARLNKLAESVGKI
ncbi:MAG: hypothetical protein ABIH50_03915 [bacterium]